MSELPLRVQLGVPDECIAAALAQAQLAASRGALPLAETLLRGVVALDPNHAVAASTLASVLLERALAEGGEVEGARAWSRWALRLAPAAPHALSVAARLARLQER
jgi:Flp pilus assembly protein TadD